MSIWKRRWVWRRITIAFAVAALAAPAAQARPAGIAPGDAGYSGPVTEQTGVDTRGNPLHYRVARETGADAPVVGPSTSRPPAEVVNPAPSAGFEWGDARVVAGLSLAALLLAAGGALAVRQRGRLAGA
jgi:hypothetical protein